MKAVFFYDSILIRKNNGKIYSRGFGYEIWMRYLDVFDSLTVSTRMLFDKNDNETNINNMSLSSGEKVNFEPILSYKKNIDLIFNRKAISREINNILNECDCAIIRMPSFIGQLACKEAEKLKKPYLIEVVGCAWDSLWNHSAKGKIIAPYNYYITKKSIKKSSYVIYVTHRFLQGKYPTDGKYIGCSDVLLYSFDEEIIKDRIEKIKNMNKKIVLGTIGSLDVRYKGQETVIKAISILEKKGYYFEYQLVGSGDGTHLRNISIQENISGNIKFLNEIAHENIFGYLDNIDIYIQPSITEGLPRSLIEAMSRGCPSIGSNIGGIPELLDENCLFTKCNYEELASLLLDIVDNKEFLIKESLKNFEKSKEYGVEKTNIIRKQFLNDYKEYSRKK